MPDVCHAVRIAPRGDVGNWGGTRASSPARGGDHLKGGGGDGHRAERYPCAMSPHSKVRANKVYCPLNFLKLVDGGEIGPHELAVNSAAGVASLGGGRKGDTRSNSQNCDFPGK